MSNPPPLQSAPEVERNNLRLPFAIFQAIDAARNARPGNISRNTWIAEAIKEKRAHDALNDGDALRGGQEIFRRKRYA